MVWVQIPVGIFNKKRKELIVISSRTGKKVILNGYVSIYMPEHERAFDNGCVYEHILVAEKMLGRKIKNEECVHHKDRNRMNNSEENLMVFKSQSDHTAFHNGMDIYLDGDVWVAKSCEESICPICNKNKKERKSKMCIECLLKERASNIPPKEDIENLIYKYPFTKIGEMYNVSDNAVRKWCKKYKLPYRRSDINKVINI